MARSKSRKCLYFFGLHNIDVDSLWSAKSLCHKLLPDPINIV